MRQLITLTFMTLTLFFSSAFAQNADLTGNNLKQNMKVAGSLFKAIGQSLNDPAQNALNADNAAQLAEIFKLTMNQFPHHMADIPAENQAEAIKAYQDMIQHTIDHCLAMQQAFLNNDNAAAKAIYDDMKDLKQEGHDRFDP